MGTIIKINFDGTYDRQRNRSASCIVARDAEREVLVSKSENHEGFPPAFAAEAIASHRAMRLGLENGWWGVFHPLQEVILLRRRRGNQIKEGQTV